MEEKIYFEEQLINYSILDLIELVFSKSIYQLFENNIDKNINYQTVDGWSLLHLCAYQYDYIVHDNKEDYLGELLFSEEEMKKNYLHSVKLKKSGLKILTIKLLKHDDIDVNLQDKEGRTPIYFAGDGWLVKELIKRGAEINPKNDLVSPLHVVSSLRNKSILPLITNNADLIKLDKFRRTPLHCAAATSSLENVLFLLFYSPSIVLNIYDNFGHTPLSYAIMFNDEDVINVILSYCLKYCDINILLKIIKDLDTGQLLIPNKNEEVDILSENLHIYDPIYNINKLFKIYFGAGHKKGKNNIRQEIKEKIEEKKKSLENSVQIFKHGDTVYYLHPDKHGQKHTKFSNKIKKLNKMEKPPATFYRKFSDIYNDTLKRVIIAYAKSGGDATLVQFNEPIGIDQNQSKKMEETQIIELYYNGSIGSHIRPKAASWLTEKDKVIDIKESEESNENLDSEEKINQTNLIPSIENNEIFTGTIFQPNNLMANEDILNGFKKIFDSFGEINLSMSKKNQDALRIELKFNDFDEKFINKISKFFENNKSLKFSIKDNLLRLDFFRKDIHIVFEKIENVIKDFSQDKNKIFF